METIKKENPLQSKSEIRPPKQKYTTEELFNSLYYQCCDADDDYDGFLHIISDIDGRETKLKIADIVHEAAKYQNKK